MFDKTTLANNKSTQKGFYRELKANAELSHEYILRFIRYIETKDSHFIVIE
jgi:hypothetical protein